MSAPRAPGAPVDFPQGACRVRRRSSHRVPGAPPPCEIAALSRAPAEEQARLREASHLPDQRFREDRPDRPAPASQPHEPAKSSYLAEKNGLSQGRPGSSLRTGLLRAGCCRPKISPSAAGRYSLREPPARKARVGVNPATGQKITIAAARRFRASFQQGAEGQGQGLPDAEPPRRAALSAVQASGFLRRGISCWLGMNSH